MPSRTGTTRGSSTSPTRRGCRRLAAPASPTSAAQDHLDGAPGLPALRADVARRLEAAGIDTGDLGRVVMLAHGRVLGHVFNPMSAFWCFGSDGRLLGVVVEVHNTYGGRHAYVLRPDDHGRAAAAKAFYVSPFNDVSGDYDIRVHLRPDRVGVAIRLVRGTRTPRHGERRRPVRAGHGPRRGLGPH